MRKAMVFIDFENFEIEKNRYYINKRNKENEDNSDQETETNPVNFPKLDFLLIAEGVVKLLDAPHDLVKTFLFVPQPDTFLTQIKYRDGIKTWINKLKQINGLSIIEGEHVARPVQGYTYTTMSPDNPSSYYVVDKGTDVSLTTHLLSKGFMNAYDTAIIISSDTDFLPAIDILTTLGKTIVVVGIEGQGMVKFRQRADYIFWMNDAFFQRCLRTK